MYKPKSLHKTAYLSCYFNCLSGRSKFPRVQCQVCNNAGQSGEGTLTGGLMIRGRPGAFQKVPDSINIQLIFPYFIDDTTRDLQSATLNIDGVSSKFWSPLYIVYAFV